MDGNNENGVKGEQALIIPDEIQQPAQVQPSANTLTEQPQRVNGKWVKGCKSPNPSGRPKVLQEIQHMLNTEHRNLDKMREVFARLRALAMGEMILVPYITADGTNVELKAEIKADARFMQLYLDRLLGVASKPLDADEDNEEFIERLFADAPPETIEFLKVKFRVMK